MVTYVSLCYSSLHINPKVAKGFMILIQNICSPQVHSILGLFADTASSVTEKSGVILMMQIPAQ